MDERKLSTGFRRLVFTNGQFWALPRTLKCQKRMVDVFIINLIIRQPEYTDLRAIYRGFSVGESAGFAVKRCVDSARTFRMYGSTRRVGLAGVIPSHR